MIAYNATDIFNNWQRQSE